MAKYLSGIPLPYAHQTDCATHNGFYKNLSKPKCVEVQTRLIENIRRRAEFGFCVSLDPAMYDRIVGSENNAPSAYTFALYGCFTILRRWSDAQSFGGEIAYVFESGHRSQREASRFIESAILASDNAKSNYRYGGHAFLDKVKTPPLQAADMIAWQYHHYHARRITKGIDTPRKDFQALIRPHDRVMDHTEETLSSFRNDIVDKGWLIGRY